MATETPELKQPPPKYPATRAADLVKQCRFEGRANKLGTLEDAGAELLTALRTAIGNGAALSPDALTLNWRLDSAELVVTIHPATSPVEVTMAKNGTEATRSATVALAYNASKARFESATEDEPAAPGQWPTRRNALEMVLEAALQVLGKD